MMTRSMQQIMTIGVQEAVEKLDRKQAVLVDIRDSQSFNAAHVTDSTLLSDQSLVQFLQQYDYDTPIMVLCYHGISSRGAAQYLLNQGFEEVYSVEGGFESWAYNYPDRIQRNPVK
jgi:thiosulfate sulfurtransferase